MRREYSEAYMRAVRGLIHGDPPSLDLRPVIARALRDLRRDHGRERAARERRHLRGIAGYFPGELERFAR